MWKEGAVEQRRKVVIYGQYCGRAIVEVIVDACRRISVMLYTYDIDLKVLVSVIVYEYGVGSSWPCCPRHRCVCRTAVWSMIQ